MQRVRIDARVEQGVENLDKRGDLTRRTRWRTFIAGRHFGVLPKVRSQARGLASPAEHGTSFSAKTASGACRPSEIFVFYPIRSRSSRGDATLETKALYVIKANSLRNRVVTADLLGLIADAAIGQSPFGWSELATSLRSLGSTITWERKKKYQPHSWHNLKNPPHSRIRDTTIGRGRSCSLAVVNLECVVGAIGHRDATRN